MKESNEAVDIYSLPAGVRLHSASPIIPTAVTGIKAGVRISTDVNKSSQESNILTWGSSEQGGNRNLNQLNSSLNLLRGNHTNGVSSTGNLRRPGTGVSNQNLITGINPGVRFASPQRMTGSFNESSEVLNRTSDNKLYELDILIDQVGHLNVDPYSDQRYQHHG